jgi:prepilin-type N-terminal cleavage/methylation domain-containing protein
MNRRRGFTLIEMLVVISIGSTLAGIAVFMLYALLHSHNTGRDHLEYCRNLNRLEGQFRRDVHAAQEMPAVDKEGNFELKPAAPDAVTIRYQCLADRIERSETRDDKIVRRESYVLWPDAEPTIQIESEPDATYARINISPKPQAAKQYYNPPVRIEALFGRDSRLAIVQGAGEEVKP